MNPSRQPLNRQEALFALLLACAVTCWGVAQIIGIVNALLYWLIAP